MIRRFRHRGLRRFYEDDDRREVNPQHADKIARMLARLDQATEPRHLDLPGWRLHPPKGEFAVVGASPSAPIGGSFFGSSRVTLLMLVCSITISAQEAAS
jgi:hypothetical protein